jgi:phage tail sheath protein FI
MPNYFDNNGNPKAQYAPFMPANSTVSGSFGAAVGDIKPGANFYNLIDGSNTQGLVALNYTASIAALANQDAYQYNVLVTPGLYNSDANYGPVMTTIINNTQNRGDNIYVMDLVPYSSSVNTAVVQAGTRNTSYAAAYWPWVQIVEPDSGQLVWIPASTVMPGVFAFNDTVSEPWFAPAGINRGGLNLVVRAETKLTQTQRDNLYSGNVNPIATFPANGVVVYGQKTLQKKASALDRVNVRRLLIALKNFISDVAQNLVFEQNTIATRNAFLAAVNPYLETVQQKQGLYAFKVIMDDSNNPADVIDRNQLVGQIYIQPTKTAEFIYLDFNILPTGATFPG